MIAPRLDTIRRAGVIFVIKDGALVEQGTHDAWLRRVCTRSGTEFTPRKRSDATARRVHNGTDVQLRDD